MSGTERAGHEQAWRPWAVALVVGLAALVYAVPLHLLNPFDVMWMNRDDTLAHWLGWEQFRHSPVLQLPLGHSEFYGLEKSTSVVFSDSIPLLALLLHPIERLLPTPFQYLGLWTIACFLLQAYFGYRLSSLLMRPPAAIAATIFFAMSSPMLNRIHVHTSLLSHWLVLAGLLFYFTCDQWRWRRWAALIAVASLVHAYLFAMTSMLWLAHLGKIAALGQLRGGPRVVAAAAGRALLVVLTVGAVMYLAGYFGVKSVNFHVYGTARYDLLNPICSYKIWSMWEDPVTCGHREFDYDGQGFLGVGMLALFAIGALAAAATLLRRRRLDLSARMPRWPLMIGCFAIVAFAATNHVVIGGKEAFSYPLPASVLNLAETFRGSGRLSWPFFYALMLGILALFARAVPARFQVFVLLPLAIYQGYDYRVGIATINADVPALSRLRELKSPAWDALSSYDRLISVPSYMAQPGWADLVWQAAKRGLGSNIGYFNRSDAERDREALTRWIRSITIGPADPRTVYVLPDDELQAMVRDRKGPQDVLIVADGHRLLFPGGARLGLRDSEPASPLPSLSLGQWHTVGPGGDGDPYLAYGWRKEEGEGRWSDFVLAGLALWLPEDQRGEAKRQDRAVALDVGKIYSRPGRPGGAQMQRYRVFVAGQLIAEGALGKDGGVISFTVPAALVSPRALHVDLELPDARLQRSGAYGAMMLRRVWVSSRPGESPPP